MATVLFFLGFLAMVALAVVIARRSGDAPRRLRGGWGSVPLDNGSWDGGSVDYPHHGHDGGGSWGGGDGGGGGGGN